MKKNTIYFSILLMSFAAFSSCKKDDTTTATSTTLSSSFSLRGNTFTTPATGGVYSAFQVGNGVGSLVTYGLTSDGKGKGIMYISFFGTSRPSAGQYSIVAGSPANASQAVLTVTDSVSVATQGIFNAVGTDNVKASVAVGATGKLSVTLPTTQLTGSNFDNSNPSNTVITTTNTTVSGTFNEQ